MNRAIFFFTFLMLITSVGYSQKPTGEDNDKPEIIRDRLMIDLFHSFWMGTPEEVNDNKFNPGFNVTTMWDFKNSNKKSPISFGLGIGMSYYTQFSNAQLKADYDLDKTLYHVIPSDVEYKLNRMTYINCHIPLEFRYRHQSGFKLNIGVRLGLIAEISQRYKGNNPDGSVSGYDHKYDLNYKNFFKDNKQLYNFDVYLRAGWKYVSLYYSYQVTSIFENGNGPKMSPMSIGVTWNIF